ncbi:MAG: c-type cytochrome, partial [Planctomycetes bacterium]|nr:c-type cytochrome [Planctomycetota bacterium]
TPFAQLTCGLADFRDHPSTVLTRAARLLADSQVDPAARLAAVRTLQLALGDLTAPSAHGTVWEGYTPRCTSVDPHLAGIVAPALREALTSTQPDLAWECARTLAMIEDDNPATLEKVAGHLTASSSPVEDLHYLIVLARLRGPRPAALTHRVAVALVNLDQKVTARHWNRDLNWPRRVAELYAGLAARDAGLHEAVLTCPDFGRPDHALFAQAPGFDRRRAAEIFLARAQADENYAWNAALITIIAALPDEQSLPVLRRLWGKAGLEEALLPVLARHPQPADRAKFVEGLASPQPATIRLCLEALEKLPSSHEATEILAFIKALRSLPPGTETKSLRDRLTGYLQQGTGQRNLGTDSRAWENWFARTYPALAPRLEGTDGVDVSAWDRRLKALDWSHGDARRGLQVFQKARCASCHSEGQAIGPDLHGVTSRFSRADLFTAILQPSKDISARYRPTLIETTDGQVVQGLIIYEAVDGLILQTGPAATIRLGSAQIVSRRPSSISLMPAGLLDPLTEEEIIDLYAYLKSLKGAPDAGDKVTRWPSNKAVAKPGQ